MTRIISVNSKEELEAIRQLFISYGKWRNHDAALGYFQKEVDGLPGKYGPPEGALFLAEEDGQPAGMIAYQKIEEGICEMKRMYVLDEFRNKGIGRKLVEALIAAAKKEGYERMRLDTHPRMKAAHALYAQMGFYEIERYNQNPTPGIRFFEQML